MSYHYSSSSGANIEYPFDLVYPIYDSIHAFFKGLRITVREVIFSILIIGVLLAIGFYASSEIEKSVLDKQLVYRQAAQISSPEEFTHAMKTDVGMAFVEGDFHAVDKVSMDKCNGQWLKIDAVFQKYTMHIRHYTTTDSKGRAHHHTRTYWTWDTYDRKSVHSSDVMFCGSKFAYEEFSYGMVRHADKQTVKNGHNHRIVFTCYPANFHATIASKLEGNAIHGHPDLFFGMNLAQTYEYFTTSHAVMIFWACWIAFIILVCLIFYRLENEWLEG